MAVRGHGRHTLLILLDLRDSCESGQVRASGNLVQAGRPRALRLFDVLKALQGGLLRPLGLNLIRRLDLPFGEDGLLLRRCILLIVTFDLIRTFQKLLRLSLVERP